MTGNRAGEMTMNAPRKRFNLDTYDPGSYDANFCLKPPLLLWLAMLYFARALVLQAAADGFFVLYLLAARRVRDVFNDFPAG